MFACICRAVTGDEVSAAIDGGAATIATVAKTTGACTGCGLCKDRLQRMLGESSRPRPETVAPAVLPTASGGAPRQGTRARAIWLLMGIAGVRGVSRI